MKLNLAIIMVAASVILAMGLAAASSIEGSFIEEPENESIENIQKQVQIASEISKLRQQVPKGYSIVNESIVGGYYIAYYDSDEVETVPCEEDVPEWKFTVCYHFVDDCHVMVHKLGSNETTIYDPRVWELSKEYGKG